MTTRAVLDSRRKAGAELRANPRDPRHGTIYGYNCGCRCRLCSAAHRWYRREKQDPELYYQQVSEAIDEIALILNGY